jgi:hypothetical protein
MAFEGLKKSSKSKLAIPVVVKKEIDASLLE